MLIQAATNGTRWEKKVNIDRIWKRLRENYPHEFSPKTTSTVEDIRASWTTYSNINNWFDNNKQPLINTGLFIDKPMTLSNGEISELTYNEESERRVICMDESDHPFTTETDRSGSRSISYGCDTDGRQGRRGTRGSRHTTGVYTFNAAGEVLPPLFIFDSTATNTENYKQQIGWSKDLPTVCIY